MNQGDFISDKSCTMFRLMKAAKEEMIGSIIAIYKEPKSQQFIAYGLVQDLIFNSEDGFLFIVKVYDIDMNLLSNRLYPVNFEVCGFDTFKKVQIKNPIRRVK